MDGEVVIGTKMDTSGFEKGLDSIKTKALTVALRGLKKFGRLLMSFLKTTLITTGIIGGAIGGIFGAAGLAHGFKKALEDSDTLRGNLQYIVAMVQVAVKNVVGDGNTILNIMNAIVKSIYTALIYINHITMTWFKLDLFKGASEKFASNMSSAEQSSKNIKNNLQQTPFDEMNVLNDTQTGAAAGGAMSTPGTPDLTSLDIPIPKWLDWIANNKDMVLNFVKALGLLLAALKLTDIVSSLSSVFSILSGLSKLQIFGMIAGVGIAILGIVETIKAIIAFIKDPTWENFHKILGGIETVLIGVGLAMVAFNATNPVGWIILAVGAIGKLVNILSNEETQAYQTKKAEDALKEARKKVQEATDAYVQAVDSAERAEKDLQAAEEKHMISGAELYKQVQEGTLDYKNMNDAQREVYKAYLINQEAQEKLIKTTDELSEANKNEAKKEIERQITLSKTSKEYDSLKEAVFDAMRKNKITTKEATDYLDKAMKNMSLQSQKTFLEDIPSDIKQAFDVNKYGEKWNTFENWWNNKIKRLNTQISIDIESTGMFQIDNSRLYYPYRAKGGLFYPSKLTKLGVGGIINRPGAGVPYHGAIIGERGAEAVVPLTDSQQMELLGESIGKNVTVNASITNMMNGRLISRILQQLQNDDNFAYNR